MLVHRYGGWYSDLDMVFLRPLVENGELLQNVIASDDVSFTLYNDPDFKYYFGKCISNALFHNDAGHPFLKTVIQLFPAYFQPGVWASSGPVLFQKAMEILCGHKKITTMNPRDHSRRHCSGMEVLQPQSFYPVDWAHAAYLNGNHNDGHWKKLFEKSYVVHFYGSSSRSTVRFLPPSNYGERKPAYSKLGPEHCPVSFYSMRPF